MTLKSKPARVFLPIDKDGAMWPFYASCFRRGVIDMLDMYQIDRVSRGMRIARVEIREIVKAKKKGGKRVKRA